MSNTSLIIYDDAIVEKLKKWNPMPTELRVLTVNDTKTLFSLNAEDTGDKGFKLPCIALSRDSTIELLQSTGTLQTKDGLRLRDAARGNNMAILNSIPIKLNYQLDIFAKDAEKAEEYLREYIFKIINNPYIIISMEYNGVKKIHRAGLKMQSSISDTSDISERIFPGQFARWTINLEITDARLWSIKFRPNYKLVVGEEVVFEDEKTHELMRAQSDLILSQYVDSPSENDTIEML